MSFYNTERSEPDAVAHGAPPNAPAKMGHTLIRLPLGGGASTDPCDVRAPRTAWMLWLAAVFLLSWILYYTR
jgi:hypothetical protein